MYIFSLSFLFLCHSPFFFNWLADVFFISWLYCFSIDCKAASMLDSSPALVYSVPTACVMFSFSSPVIALPMIRRKHSPTPTGHSGVPFDYRISTTVASRSHQFLNIYGLYFRF